MVDRGAPPREEGLDVGQELGPREEPGGDRELRHGGRRGRQGET
jgi:hypothetical protein